VPANFWPAAFAAAGGRERRQQGRCRSDRRQVSAEGCKASPPINGGLGGLVPPAERHAAGGGSRKSSMAEGGGF